jgi:hypothetical protein
MQADQVTRIARRLNAPESEVIDMNRRLQGDMSLNARSFDDDHEGLEWQDRLGRHGCGRSLCGAERQRATSTSSRTSAERAFRERAVYHQAGWLTDSPLILDELGAELGISRERVRQVEERAIQKVRVAIAAALGGGLVTAVSLCPSNRATRLLDDEVVKCPTDLTSAPLDANCEALIKLLPLLNFLGPDEFGRMKALPLAGHPTIWPKKHQDKMQPADVHL